MTSSDPQINWNFALSYSRQRLSYRIDQILKMSKIIMATLPGTLGTSSQYFQQCRARYQTLYAVTRLQLTQASWLSFMDKRLSKQTRGHLTLPIDDIYIYISAMTASRIQQTLYSISLTSLRIKLLSINNAWVGIDGEFLGGIIFFKYWKSEQVIVLFDQTFIEFSDAG